MRVAKFIVAAVAAGVLALQVALSDNAITSTKAVTVALAVLGALGVYAVPNSPPDES